MHILSTFKRLLAAPVSANDNTKHSFTNPNYALNKSKLHSYDSQNTTLAFLQSLQMMCGQIPGSEVMVQMKGREVNFHLSWDENSAAPFSDEIMFSLNGRDNNATLYKEATENKATDKTKDQSSAIKENSHEKEQAVKDTSSKDSNKPTGKQTMMQSLQTFLKSHYVFRFNSLTTQTEFAKVSQEKADSHRLMFKPLNKRNLNGISCAALNNGIDCWDKDIKRYVESDNVKEYNPFTLYFDNLPKWDGKDRVAPLAGRVSPNNVWVNGFHRWMLAMTAGWMRYGDGKAANSVVPILVSRKQGLGKSTFCRMLMPIELQRYFTESYDLSSISAAENKLSNFGLINLDEFDKLSKKKMPLLKNLIQMESLNTRRAYQQFNEPVSRLASFIGTSNRYDLLTDTTGSRRFICVDVKQKIDCSPIEYAQLYAQLKAELESGKRYWFSKREEREIQHHNKSFYAHGIEEDIFNDCFRFATADDEANTDVKVFTLSATEIYEKMKKHHPAAMRGVTSDKVSRMLPGLGRRIHTRYGNGYRVIQSVNS